MFFMDKFKSITLLLALFLTACTTVNLNISQRIALPCAAKFLVGPLANYSDTPLANKQVESMLAGLLHAKGFIHAQRFPLKTDCNKLIFCPEQDAGREAVLRYARQNHYRYWLTGSANEWRYKVGLDGEPVAGVSLAIIEVQSGRTIWTGVGSIIGNARLGLDGVGQDLLNQLLKSVNAMP